MLYDLDIERARTVEKELGAETASRDKALAADVVVTVTPGRDIVFPEGSLQPGQHVSLMGADGPGKAEIAVEEMTRVRLFCDDWEKPETNGITRGRVRLFCDDWEQASHGGDLANAVRAGAVDRDDVAQLGDVLAGKAKGRQSEADITIFDSTGLAIQDLAIALAALDRADELDLPILEL
jgi:ornithine cyclodeaminase/alanine dehydrogenase-like protein (mu-crystallin family)